ncbi:MAG: hypothetical protein ABL884_02690 [Methyloglobulus sp.]
MKIIDDLLNQVRNAWLNPFRPFSSRMSQLMGAKRWWDTPAIVHPLPIVVTLLGSVLLNILPDDILSSSPLLLGFTDFMGWLIPGIPTFAENTGSQALLLVHALNWIFVPYWIWITSRAAPLFHVYIRPFFKIIRSQQIIKNFAAMPEYQRSRGRVLFAIILGGPLLFGFGIWCVWSGFIFHGGPPTLARGLIYENLFQLTLWNWLLPQIFVGMIYVLILYIAMLPVYFRYVITGEIK